MSEFNGLNLFNDVEDVFLKTRNRAVVMFNIFDDNHKEGKLSSRHTAELVGYFRQIPEMERKEAYDKFQEMLRERGMVA